MNKYFVWGLVVLYWLWPFDLVPGNPLDDIVIVVLAWCRDDITGYLKGATSHD